MRHIQGTSRQQTTLFPETLDEFIAPEHPVRVIDAFVESLALARLGFAGAIAAETGRPGYHPGDLLKLYVYGYLQQLRSSRRLEREAQRNLEVLWRMNRLTPSYKTIADFRRDHVQAVVGVCRSFTELCRAQGLFAAQRVAIDGTKLKAVASDKRVLTPERIARQQARIDQRISDDLQALDTADAEEADHVPPAQAVDIAAAVHALHARRDELQHLAEQMQAEDLTQTVAGEPEARRMRTPHGYRVAYNAQIAVDAQHKLIAYAEVTHDGNDRQQLQPMALATQAELQADTLTVVADTGYANGAQGRQCAEHGITAIVPRPEVVNPKGKTYFTRERFAYDAASDTYRCPAGDTLHRQRTSQTHQNQHYGTPGCGSCPLKARCTGGRRRVIVRSFFEDDIAAMHQRALSNPTWLRQRRCLAEHPFGTLKWMLGVPRFLLRGLRKVRGEWALTVLGYNLKRVINILGVKHLLDVLQTHRPACPSPA
jgi:transposase